MDYNKLFLGIVTLSGFLYFWGWIFVVTTTLVALLKTESKVHNSQHESVPDGDVKTAYSLLLQIFKLAPIRTLVLILLTCKVCKNSFIFRFLIVMRVFVLQIGFSATDSVMSLKLVETGIPKEQLGLMAVPLIPLQIALPLVISKYTTGTFDFILLPNYIVYCTLIDYNSSR